MNAKEQSQGKWRGILSAYIESEYLTGKHTKCPLCGGVDRFRFDDKEGRGSYFCNSCGAGTGIHLLAQHQGISHKDAWDLVEKIVGTVQIEQKSKVDEVARIKEILATCKEGGEFVRQYLSSRYIENSPETLLTGFYWINGGKCQAMIAKAAKGSKLVGLHATFIREDKKIGRRMYAIQKGALVGSAIRLHKLGNSEKLIIGEGIESTLSAAEIRSIPAWAAMDAGKMEMVEIPQQVKTVIIAADNDESFTGQAAAYNLAKRLKSQGKIVEIMMPEKIGTDWNDYLREIRSAKSD